MTDDKWMHYAIRGAEEDLLDWGEKKRAVLALKNDDEGNNELIDRMVAGIEDQMHEIQADLDVLKGRL